MENIVEKMERIDGKRKISDFKIKQKLPYEVKLQIHTENKIILDLCGGTGSWSKPYKEAGYDVRLITLPEMI